MDGKTPCGRTKKEGKHGGGKQGGCAHDFKKNDLKTWKEGCGASRQLTKSTGKECMIYLIYTAGMENSPMSLQ